MIKENTKKVIFVVVLKTELLNYVDLTLESTVKS